jgi:hypothetical protein
MLLLGSLILIFETDSMNGKKAISKPASQWQKTETLTI